MATAERLFVALDKADPVFNTTNLVALLFAYDQWSLAFPGVPGRATEIPLSTGPEAWQENAQAIADILGTSQITRAVGLLLRDLIRAA